MYVHYLQISNLSINVVSKPHWNLEVIFFVMCGKAGIFYYKIPYFRKALNMSSILNRNKIQSYIDRHLKEHTNKY